MAVGNRDVAASVGLPAAVNEHPGFKDHIDPVKFGERKQHGIQGSMAKREAMRGGRLSRHTRTR